MPRAKAAPPQKPIFFATPALWYRRSATHWVVSAKREETRERRLAQLVADCAAGRKIGPLARPTPVKTRAR